jgi:site-specific DNA-methyltransferase (adenine-specific)
MEAMAGFDDNQFDLAIVDPPYGIGMGGSLNVNSKVNYKNKNWDTEIPNNNYFIELKRISKNQIVWGGNYFPYLWKNGCKGFICWNKLNHHENRADVEMAYTSFNKLAKYFEYMWDGNRYGTKGNIKGVGKPTIRIHPTEKPIALYEWILMNYAKKGDKILDTHLGSGSIAIACHNLGYDLEGYELDKDYYIAAKKRLQEHQSQLRMF